MNQIAEATRPPGGGSGGGGSGGGGSAGGGSGSGPETSNLTCSLFGQAGSLFQGTAGSNPFSDSHAISTLGKVTVNNLDRVEMSTYHEETTNGRL
jgi:hypothetical protein